MIEAVQRFRRTIALCASLGGACHAPRTVHVPLQAELSPLPRPAGSTYVSHAMPEPLGFVQIQLELSDDQFSFVAECNQLSGSYRLQGDQLLVADLTSKQTFCIGPQRFDEVWLRKFLLAKPMLTQQGDTLTFFAERAKLVFMERAAAERDRPLVGVEWTVETYMDADGALALNVQAQRLTFLADGTFSMAAACSASRGSYRSGEGGILLLSDVQFEDDICKGETELQAARFLRTVLSAGELNMRIAGRRLWLERAGTSLGLRSSR